VLKFNGQEVKGTPSVFQGEKVTGNDQLSLTKPWFIHHQNSFNYVPEMAKSELYLDFSVATKKKHTLYHR
jgi:hypothetical protein